MIQIGKYNTLKIVRDTSVGLFLSDGEKDILLPNKYVPKTFEIGGELNVFVYLDHEERLTATTLKPYIKLGEFAYLKVNYINQYGAFLDWGLEKDLFVPFKEQARKMEEGKRYLVYAYLDEQTDRLVASSKSNQFLETENIELEPNQEVDLIVSHITELGINVIINSKYKGLLYKDEVYDNLSPGKKIKGYIKAIRPDKKIDVSLTKTGVEAIDDSAQVVLDELKASKGFLRLTDNSHPEEIKTVLKMSKKAFKKAIGNLYKQKIITIQEDGIYLNK
jgi:predicted RNA-binding protein (virulence factor B family)